jgi:hypothetical protein
MFCVPGHVFDANVGVGSRFHVLRARTHFRPYRGCRVSFSCYARPNSFSAVMRATSPVFMFYAPGLILGGNEGVESYFHVLRSRSRFLWYRGRRVRFSCFACPDSFSAVLRALGPLYMFCGPELILGDTDGVGSHFHVLRGRTHFQYYIGRRVPF